MAITAMLILDVGGDDLAVEVQVTGLSRAPDRSGISKKRALGGAMLVTQLFTPRLVFPPFTTGPLTTEQLNAIKTAAGYPETRVVGGDALRIDNANTVGQTVAAKVSVDSDDFLATGGTDFFHIAHITVEQAD
jgi:hypothetical protein